MQTCLYHDQVTWPLLSCAVKSFRELHSHTMYIENSFTDDHVFMKFNFGTIFCKL